jgi:sortase B
LKSLSGKVKKLNNETKNKHVAEKKTFAQVVFPQKNDSVWMKVNKILVLVFLTVFIVSGCYLLNEMVYKPYVADKSMNEINSEFNEVASNENVVSDTEESETVSTVLDSEGEESTVTINDTVLAVQQLRQKYPDMVGWIKIAGTEIHFPVMQSSTDDPEYYLYRNYRGESIKYGSIFLDSNCSVDGDIQILFGHSMMDGRMFWKLIDFGKLDVYSESPVINYDTYKEAGKWKIVSVFKTNTYSSQGTPFDYLYTQFADNESKMQYIYQCMQRTIINTGVDITDTDRFLLLSTCSYEFDGFRTVVVARKVRDGEDDTVDVSKAEYNSNPLYPDIWYWTYGGSAPVYPENFRDAVAQGLCPWYTPAS